MGSDLNAADVMRFHWHLRISRQYNQAGAELRLLFVDIHSSVCASYVFTRQLRSSVTVINEQCALQGWMSLRTGLSGTRDLPHSQNPQHFYGKTATSEIRY